LHRSARNALRSRETPSVTPLSRPPPLEPEGSSGQETKLYSWSVMRQNVQG